MASAKKCPNSPSGNHVWKYHTVRNNLTGEEAQYRKCVHCDLEQKHEKDIMGHFKGWK
jgi:hypothetical protein